MAAFETSRIGGAQRVNVSTEVDQPTPGIINADSLYSNHKGLPRKKGFSSRLDWRDCSLSHQSTVCEDVFRLAVYADGFPLSILPTHLGFRISFRDHGTDFLAFFG